VALHEPPEEDYPEGEEHCAGEIAKVRVVRDGRR